MDVNANQIKSDFSYLKYEQLLTDKYFINTCFSQKLESYSNRQRLKDLFMRIKMIQK